MPLLPLTDPWFNVREVCKELCLLEQHLVEEGRRCMDCIGKHFLTAEGLCDEAQRLGADDPAVERLVAPAARQLRAMWDDVFVGEGDCLAAGQQVRALRKVLVASLRNRSPAAT